LESDPAPVYRIPKPVNTPVVRDVQPWKKDEEPLETKPAIPANIEIIPSLTDPDDSPDDEDSESEEGSAAPTITSTPAPQSGDDESSAGIDDRWSGTLARDWGADAPASSAAELSKVVPAKKRISLGEAVGKIPPEAIEFLRDKFKTDIHRIRAYEKTGAKD
jgi:hypothetical protein